jgi:hypothetical protein
MKIGVIDVNDLKYSDDQMTHTTFSKQKILDILEDYIVFKEVSNDDNMLELVVDELQGAEYLIHTATVKNIYNDLYLMCHIAQTKEIYEDLKTKGTKYNGIASYLTDTGLRVYGRAVIFKLENDNGDKCKLKSITLDEITDMFISKFVHKGVIANVDGTIDEFKFIFNPVDWIPATEISKYKYHETDILGKVFMIFFDTTAPSGIPNDTASKLCPSHPINGRIIVGMREQFMDMNDTDVRYEDLDVDTFKQIILLCINPLQPRGLVDGEDINGQVVNGNRKYNNLHKILRNRHLVQK